jgi:hypothetical protein
MKRENIRSKGLVAIGVIKGLFVLGGHAIDSNFPSNSSPSVLRGLCFGQGYLQSGRAAAEDLRSDFPGGIAPPLEQSADVALAVKVD